MALTTIKYGELASSEVVNNNFKYLDDKISNLNETVTSNKAGMNSNIASINSSITTINENMTKNVEKLEESINEAKSFLSESGLFVTTYINGVSWYKEYFSDSEKKTRVWLEQGGVLNSRSSIAFLKNFTSINYTLLLGTHCTYYEGGGISGKSQSGFSHYNGKGWSYNVEWYACGQ